MKFLQTSDWQLGAKVAQAGDRASDLRKRRFDAAEAAVQIAKDEEVDFILIAGDLFEDHNIADSMVHRAVRILDELAPIPAFVLPGNHDPLRPGGVWERASWKAAGDHVRLLDNPEPVGPSELEGLVLYPCPLQQKQSTRDPTAWIPEREQGDDRIRIGVAHGSILEITDAANFPIDPDRPETADLDYLALGDWHGTTIQERLAYPGTIEQSAFDEKDPGNVLIVEIEESGAEPKIEKHRVGQLRWAAMNVDLQDVTDVDALEEDLNELGAPEDLVLRVGVRVLSDADNEAMEALGRLENRLAEEAFYVEWTLDNSEFLISAAPDLPPGLVSRADESLAEILDGEIPEGPGREFANRDPEIVREARKLLRRLAREERR